MILGNEVCLTVMLFFLTVTISFVIQSEEISFETTENQDISTKFTEAPTNFTTDISHEETEPNNDFTDTSNQSFESVDNLSEPIVDFNNIDNSNQLSNDFTDNPTLFTFKDTNNPTETTVEEIGNENRDLKSSTISIISENDFDDFSSQYPNTEPIPTTAMPMNNATMYMKSSTDFICQSQLGLYPNLQNCNQYYDCSHNVPSLQQCPSYLHFNPKAKVCDWPELAGCKVSSTANSTDLTIETYTSPNNATDNLTTIFKCPTMYGLYSNVHNCSEFYHCSYWIPYLKNCPSRLHFNHVLEVCDWPMHAGCDTAKKEVIPDGNITFACPSTFGYFADVTNCGRFYQCSNYKPYRKECPSNLHFNVKLQVCDWPTAAGCK